MPSVLEYRPLDPSDLEAAGRLLVDSYPHRAHEPAWWCRPAPQEQMVRWGIFHRSDPPADHLVAYAALWRVDGHKFRFDVIVSPQHRRAGRGNRLFEVMKDGAKTAGAETLQARAYATDFDSLAFLDRRQFAETMRMRGFVLSLAAADIDSLTVAAHSCSASDVSIQVVSPSQYNDETFWNQLADVHDAARDGWPDPDPGGAVTSTDPSSLRRMLMPSDDATIAFLIATRGDQFAGYSLLSGRRDSGEAQFASTAVRPSMRGQRIATALRARCILGAHDSGFEAVRSASGNASLIRINKRFNFQDTYTEVRLVCRLRCEHSLPSGGTVSGLRPRG